MLKQAVLAATLGIAAIGAAQSQSQPPEPDGRAGDLQQEPIFPIGPRVDTQSSPEQPGERQPSWVDENSIPASSRLSPLDQHNPEISPSAPEIRLYVARLTNVALSPGGVRMAVELLATDDRQRIEEQLRDLPADAHDELVMQFRAQWKARYGDDFDLSRQRVLMGDYFVLRGLRTPEEAILASNQLSPAAQTSATTAPSQAAAPQRDQSATLVVPGNPDLKQPAIVLTLSNHSAAASNWRLDVPETLQARGLQENIDARLRRLLDGREKWPTNSGDAYRLIAYSVLASFNDQPVDRRQEPMQPAKPPAADNPSIPS